MDPLKIAAKINEYRREHESSYVYSDDYIVSIMLKDGLLTKAEADTFRNCSVFGSGFTSDNNIGLRFEYTAKNKSDTTSDKGIGNFINSILDLIKDEKNAITIIRQIIIGIEQNDSFQDKKQILNIIGKVKEKLSLSDSLNEECKNILTQITTAVTNSDTNVRAKVFKSIYNKLNEIEQADPFASIEIPIFYLVHQDVLQEIAQKPQNTMRIETGKKFKTLEEAAEHLLKKRGTKYKQADIDKLAVELIMLNSNNDETTIDDKVNNALKNINNGTIKYADNEKYKYITKLIKNCGFEQNFENSAIYQTIYSILDTLQHDGRRGSINLFNQIQTALEEAAKTKNPEELKRRLLTEFGINIYSEKEQDKAREIQLQSFTTGLLSSVYGYLAGQSENLYENGGLFNSFANKLVESADDVANRLGKDIYTNKEEIEFLKETAGFWNEYKPTANSNEFKAKFKRIYGKDFDEKKAKDLMNYCSKNPNLDIFKDKKFQKKFKEFCGTDIITDIKKSLKGQQYTAMAGNAVMTWMGMNATGALLGTNYMGYCLGNGLSKLGLSGKTLQLATGMPIGSATFATWTLAEKTLENAITLQGPASEKWDNIAKAVGQSAEFGAFASALNVLLISPMVSPNVERGLNKGAEYVKLANQPVSLADYMKACEAGSSPVIKNGLVKFGYSLAVNTVGFTAHQTAADLITNGTEPFKNGNGGNYIGNLLLENFKTIMTFEGINLITGGYAAGNIANEASRQVTMDELSKNFECLKNFKLEPKGDGFLINFPQAVEVNGKTMTSMSVNTPAEMFSMVVTIMNAETNWKINNSNPAQQGQNNPRLQTVNPLSDAPETQTETGLTVTSQNSSVVQTGKPSVELTINPPVEPTVKPPIVPFPVTPNGNEPFTPTNQTKKPFEDPTVSATFAPENEPRPQFQQAEQKDTSARTRTKYKERVRVYIQNLKTMGADGKIIDAINNQIENGDVDNLPALAETIIDIAEMGKQTSKSKGQVQSDPLILLKGIFDCPQEYIPAKVEVYMFAKTNNFDDNTTLNLINRVDLNNDVESVAKTIMVATSESKDYPTTIGEPKCNELIDDVNKYVEGVLRDGDNYVFEFDESTNPLLKEYYDYKKTQNVRGTKMSKTSILGGIERFILTESKIATRDDYIKITDEIAKLMPDYIKEKYPYYRPEIAENMEKLYKWKAAMKGQYSGKAEPDGTYSVVTDKFYNKEAYNKAVKEFTEFLEEMTGKKVLVGNSARFDELFNLLIEYGSQSGLLNNSDVYKDVDYIIIGHGTGSSLVTDMLDPNVWRFKHSGEPIWQFLADNVPEGKKALLVVCEHDGLTDSERKAVPEMYDDNGLYMNGIGTASSNTDAKICIGGVNHIAGHVKRSGKTVTTQYYDIDLEKYRYTTTSDEINPSVESESPEIENTETPEPTKDSDPAPKTSTEKDNSVSTNVVRSGNFDKSLALIADNLISQTNQHLSVKGGVETQAQIIETVSEELGKYLVQYKGKHITKGQLEAFYKEVFPELNVVIDGSQPEKDLLGSTPKALTRTPYTKGEYKGSIEIQLHSESPIDKLKGLFGNENEETFYVTPDFVDSFIHENVHVMQMYMKPVDKIYQNTLKNIAETRHPEYADSWFSGYGIDGAMAYSIIVYKEEWPLLFNEGRFIERVKKSLDVYYATDDVKIAHLKQFIRYSEEEKQAYELGILNKLRFEHPDLADKPFYDRLFRKIAAKEADSFKFERKIEVMKKEYFRMIEEERSKIKGEDSNDEISPKTEIKQESEVSKDIKTPAPKYTPEPVSDNENPIPTMDEIKTSLNDAKVSYEILSNEDGNNFIKVVSSYTRENPAAGIDYKYNVFKFDENGTLVETLEDAAPEEIKDKFGKTKSVQIVDNSGGISSGSANATIPGLESLKKLFNKFNSNKTQNMPQRPIDELYKNFIPK